MSNLSDLLPAGAAAKQLTFTDSGSGIATKKPVILNSDGTVTEVGTTTLSIAVGSAIDFSGGTATGKGYYASVCYDTANDKIFIAYRDADNSGYGTGVVCTVSGTTLSVGTPVVFSSNLTSYTSCCFDSSNNKVFVAYQNSSGQGEAVVATISGTSVSYGAAGRIEGGGSQQAGYIEAVYDANASKVFTAYYDSYNVGAYGTVHTISGTGFSSGSPASFGSYYYPLGITYDSTAQKIITTIQTSVSTLFSVSVTISGTNWANGTYLSIGPCNGNADVSYDPVQDKTLQYFNDATANTGKVAVLSLSGTTLSSGSQVDNTGSGEGYLKAVYNAASASHVIMWSTGSAGKARDVTISGTTPTLNATTTDWSSDYLDYIGAAYDEDQKVTVIATANDVAPKCYAIAYQSAYEGTNLDATNFVGVADSAISSSAAGSIIVQGGTVSGVAGPSTLSAGSPVTYLSAGGYYGAIAYDTNSDKVVVVNRDDSSTPSGYGVAYVGTVSGTSISYGTQVVFNSGTSTNYIDICFDASNNTVVVVYKDGGNSGYGTAIVGTVAGGNITFGSEVVFNSASTDACKVVYDSSNNKVVVSYRDTGNSNYGTAIVGTVSGTSISFGTAAVFDSQAIEADNGSAIAFDTSSNQVIILYRESATYYINAVTGSVSGTSITFGTPVDISTDGIGSYHDYPSVCYDSTANKLLFAFRWASSTGAGLAKVGTVSGTAISVGTVVEFGAKAKYLSSVFDTSLNQVVISYQEYGTTTYGYLVKATISGTDVTFSTPEVWSGTTPVTYLDTVYDPDTQSIVSTFADSAASYYGKSIVAKFSTDLTAGTKYYVTTSGGFSSSADTPSVNAGLAISTTSLLLNGDS